MKPYGSPVVGYVRSAKLNDPELDKAEALIRAYAEERGYNLVKVFREEGISSVAAWRPKFDEMVRGLERGEWVGVIVANKDGISAEPDIGRRLRTLLESLCWVTFLD